VNPGVYPREPTVAQLLTGLMQDAQKLLRQEVALATHELRRELRTTIRAVMSLGIGIGLAATASCGGCWPRVGSGCSSSARRRWRSSIWCPRTQWKR
jgi:hypothetical protein